MQYKVVVGDVTNPTITADHCYLPQIVNDENRQSAGVAKAIYEKWPLVKSSYHKWFTEYGKFLIHNIPCSNPSKLGRFQLVEVEENLTVVNMIAQSDCGGYQGYPPIRYQSLYECLIRFADYLKTKDGGFEVAAPLFGTGLANGDKYQIFDIVHTSLKDLNIIYTWYVLSNKEV